VPYALSNEIKTNIDLGYLQRSLTISTVDYLSDSWASCNSIGKNEPLVPAHVLRR